MRFFKKKGLSSLSAITLFFVGLCIIPCGALKEAHAGSVHDQMASYEKATAQKTKKMTDHSCHEKDLSADDKASLNNASSCPHCKSEIPVIMQEAKIKYLSPELPLRLAHWQLETLSVTKKSLLPEDDPPPEKGKHPIHILHSIFII